MALLCLQMWYQTTVEQFGDNSARLQLHEFGEIISHLETEKIVEIFKNKVCNRA